MRHPIKPWIAALGALVIATSFAVPAAAGSASSKTRRKSSSLNVCSFLSASQLAQAQIDAPCHKLATTTVPIKKSRAGGTVGSVGYGARWGTAALPSHYIAIVVGHLLGSGTGVEYLQTAYRSKVLGNGAPVPIGQGTASLLTESVACVNPPSDECIKGTFLAIKGRWTVTAYLDDHPPTAVATSEPERTVAEDEAAAKAEEELVKPILLSIGKTAVARV